MLTKIRLVMDIIELMNAEIVPIKVFKLARHFSENELHRIRDAVNRKAVKNVS